MVVNIDLYGLPEFDDTKANVSMVVNLIISRKMCVSPQINMSTFLSYNSI